MRSVVRWALEAAKQVRSVRVMLCTLRRSLGLRKPASKQNLNSKPLSPMSRPQYASWRVVKRPERAER